MKVVDRIIDAKGKQVWLLLSLAVFAVYLVAPAALMPMLLVAAKAWAGLLIGWTADHAFFAAGDEWEWRRAGLMAACVLGMTLGV